MCGEGTGSGVKFAPYTSEGSKHRGLHVAFTSWKWHVELRFYPEICM